MWPSNHGQYIGDEDNSRSAFVSVYFENQPEGSEIFEENGRPRNELNECHGRLGGESGNRESSSSTDTIFSNGSTKSTLLQPQGRSKHLICALEALEAFIRAVCAGKRDFKRSTESCITVTHRGNGTAGIILYPRSHGRNTEAL